ncbi:MAG: 30S ribosomal protein S20 [Candidatus Dormiibacterota bacterium]
MANIRSAKKDIRRTAKRTLRNRSVRSAVKTHIVKFRRGLVDGVEETPELATVAIASLDRAAAKGILHPNNVARRKSRIQKRLNEAQTAPAE